jgi:hypothetical protein
MIKLKQILLEQKQNEKPDLDLDIKMDVPSDKTGTIIKGISKTDPWEYYFHDADGMWKTKRRTASRFLDMKTKLIRVYGEEAGNTRYETAVGLLNAYLNNPEKAKSDGKTVEPVVIPNDKVEVPKIKDVHIDYDTQKVKEVWISVNGERHRTVTVTGKTDDGKYLEIENPRKIHLHKTVYVNASSFKLSTDGKTADYNGAEGKRYEIYKIK